MTILRPMLAAPVDLTSLKYPVLVSPKLDGVRAVVVNGKLMSRTNKPIPNTFVQKKFSVLGHGLDGELIVGEPFAKDVYRKTISTVMSFYDQKPVSYFVFDVIGPHVFNERLIHLQDYFEDIKGSSEELKVKYLPQRLVQTEKELIAVEEEVLRIGYEGLILRSPSGKYKFGRSTVREGGMLKMKRFVDAEAVIIGKEELMINANEAREDERGYTSRSSHQENLILGHTLGALVVRDASGREFRVGTGFTAEERAKLWDDPATVGKTIKFKSFPIGEKDLPRHPVFLGFRDTEIDGAGIPETTTPTKGVSDV